MSNELSRCGSACKQSKAESDEQAVLKGFMLPTDYHATNTSPDFLLADSQTDIKHSASREQHSHIFVPFAWLDFDNNKRSQATMVIDQTDNPASQWTFHLMNHRGSVKTG